MKKLPYSLLVLILSTLACRPVLAISGSEFLVISVLCAVLLGPPLYRLMRRVEQFRKREKKEKEH